MQRPKKRKKTNFQLMYATKNNIFTKSMVAPRCPS
uniref:Uncharacterized protein n=1 Tax=Rhizophora mucronata TaxID=61149 RepID=A0A2P2PB67_RHIMU